MRGRQQASSGPPLRWIALEPVFLDLRVEQSAVNPQHFRGFRAIPVRVPERLHDEVLLELRNGFLEEALLGGDLLAKLLVRIGVVLAERKLATGDDLAARQHDGTLDDILELADIARPFVLHETLE